MEKKLIKKVRVIEILFENLKFHRDGDDDNDPCALQARYVPLLRF